MTEPHKNPSIPLSATIDSILAQFPPTAAVLNAFGVDTCCGGARSLGDAAADAGVDPELLCTMLEAHALPWRDRTDEATS